jgi:hypothetical protein
MTTLATSFSDLAKAQILLPSDPNHRNLDPLILQVTPAIQAVLPLLEPVDNPVPVGDLGLRVYR